MSWLSRFSLAQRALTGLMSIVALVFGAIAIPQLKQQLLPSIELPVVSVPAPYQGASPDVVEKQVVEPIEDNLKAVDGITGVTSTASEGNAGKVRNRFEEGGPGESLQTFWRMLHGRARQSAAR
ncbi:efflux RND transporter permease subunit [Streptomyces sp. NPDC046197]|uniref:efflux RND transporter permease subunit n=1 Tax=Streptomyces sp. NPDC046197 TaxID=3154337 RepID=UPI0033DF31FD